jgi:hypothetical protein
MGINEFKTGGIFSGRVSLLGLVQQVRRFRRFKGLSAHVIIQKKNSRLGTPERFLGILHDIFRRKKFFEKASGL